jgi:hypothetical protein
MRATPLPPGVLPAALLVFAAGTSGPNWSLALGSIGVLLAGSALLWRPREAPILLFIFLYHWLQASVWTFSANWHGVSIDEMGRYGAENALATALTLVALVVFALGMKFGAGPRADPRKAMNAALAAGGQPMRTWFLLYAVAMGTASIAQSAAYLIPGLSQPLLALAGLKWAFFFILGYASFLRGASAGQLFLIAFAIEFILSIGGYFSDFKTVFLVTIMAAIASGSRASFARLLGLGVLASAGVVLGIVWTAIKMEYREFASGGQTAQVVSVDYGSRVAKLASLISDLDQERLLDATNQMISRLGYVEFFGAAIEHVPKVVPHENGALLLDAILRPFMPRLFFPDKSVIDDSDRTNTYTGLGVSGADAGTSISLGWIAESYVDFGAFGMMPAVMLVGLAYGVIYRRLTQRGDLLGMGFATSVLFQVLFLESSITKVVGGLAVSLLVVWLLRRHVLPQIVPWLLQPARNPQQLANA